MKDNKYNSHIGKPIVRTTSNGGRYVRPFDIIRSESGRAVIKSHSSSATAAARAKISDSAADKSSKSGD